MLKNILKVVHKKISQDCNKYNHVYYQVCYNQVNSVLISPNQRYLEEGKRRIESEISLIKIKREKKRRRSKKEKEKKEKERKREEGERERKEKKEKERKREEGEREKKKKRR